MDLPLQQDRSRDCRYAARCHDLGDASGLCCRISTGVLDSAAFTSPARAFSPIWTARLRPMACIFTRRLARILARLRRFTLPRDPFGDTYLFSYAIAD